jgi:hypothetical protein
MEILKIQGIQDHRYHIYELEIPNPAYKDTKEDKGSK